MANKTNIMKTHTTQIALRILTTCCKTRSKWKSLDLLSIVPVPWISSICASLEVLSPIPVPWMSCLFDIQLPDAIPQTPVRPCCNPLHSTGLPSPCPLGPSHNLPPSTKKGSRFHHTKSAAKSRKSGVAHTKTTKIQRVIIY